MKCPVCEVQLSISAREGVEIDYCAQCRGVWLDRGELDKIIDRAATSLAPDPVSAPSVGGDRPRGEWSEPRYDRGRDDRYYDSREGHGYKRKKRRGSFLEDLFDFD